MSDDLLNDLDYMAMNAVIKGSTPERAAARIRELDAEVARLREANRDAFLRERDAADDAWNEAIEAASAWLTAQVAMPWYLPERILTLKRETKE